jgi:HMG (high mobility group) box
VSAFLYFSQGKRAVLKKENPTLKNTEISRLLGEMWRNASEEDKRPHVNREMQERTLYKVAIAEWRADFDVKQEAQKKAHAEQMLANSNAYAAAVASAGYAPPVFAPTGMQQSEQQPHPFPHTTHVGAPMQFSDPNQYRQAPTMNPGGFMYQAGMPTAFPYRKYLHSFTVFVYERVMDQSPSDVCLLNHVLVYVYLPFFQNTQPMHQGRTRLPPTYVAQSFSVPMALHIIPSLPPTTPLQTTGRPRMVVAATIRSRQSLAMMTVGVSMTMMGKNEKLLSSFAGEGGMLIVVFVKKSCCMYPKHCCWCWLIDFSLGFGGREGGEREPFNC